MEADSPTIRDTLWTWFTQVIASRLMDETGRIMLIQTRWHQDDLIGRLTDPQNSYYDPEEAAEWQIIDLPALAFDDGKDPLGRKEGEPLWPGRFGSRLTCCRCSAVTRVVSARSIRAGRRPPAARSSPSSGCTPTGRTSCPPTCAATRPPITRSRCKQDADKTCLPGGRRRRGRHDLGAAGSASGAA